MPGPWSASTVTQNQISQSEALNIYSDVSLAPWMTPTLWGFDEGRFFLMPLRVLIASVLITSRPSLRLLFTDAQPHRDFPLPLQGLSL